MALQKEIERKYLVKAQLLPPLTNGSKLEQGYLGFSPTVRVRTEITEQGEQLGFLTIKGEGMLARDEFEYAIPYDEAHAMLQLAQGSVISKTRYRLKVAKQPALKWEIDVFEGDNAGLIVAEIELPTENTEIEPPAWLGTEVTLNSAYKNASLARNPLKK